MNTINGILIDQDLSGDEVFFRSLFQANNTSKRNSFQRNFTSPFIENNRPSDGSSLKTDIPVSVFDTDYSYTIVIKTYDSGTEVLKKYYDTKPGEREIHFFCEKSNSAKSNLFKTFVLVKYGEKYRELVYDLKEKKSAGVISRRKNSTVGYKIENFEDEVTDNFNIITKGFNIDTDLETIRFIMDNELDVTSNASKTISQLYSWYNKSISFIIDGINGWLNELKFKDYQPDKKPQKNEDSAFDKAIDYLIPDVIEDFISKTLENALTTIKGYIKENLPQSWVNFLRKAYNTIKGILNTFKKGIHFLSDLAQEAFYLWRAFLMGFVNGLLNTIETILSLIGWLLKSNGDEVLTGENYRKFKEKLEFIEDFIDLVNEKASDIFTGIEQLIEDFSFEKLKDTLSVFGNKLKDFNSYDYAYMAGLFIFEVVVGVILAFFTGGASLVAEAANATEKAAVMLKIILKEVISTATFGVLEILKLFRILISKFVLACQKGWKGFKQFLNNLFKSKTDDVVKNEGKVLDEIHDGASLVNRGRYLGQILSEIDIQKIKSFLTKHKVDLQISEGGGVVDVLDYFYPSGNVVKLQAHQAAMFITDGQKMKLVLRNNATLYEAFHELMHFRDCQNLGKKAFLNKHLVDREKFVYDKMIEYSKYLNRDEIAHAKNYINFHYKDVGKTDHLGNPIEEILPFDLNKIPKKRKIVNIDKILKLK